MKLEALKANLNALFDYKKRIEDNTGKRLYIVGATKTRTAEEINLAVSLGLEIVGENRAQEFRDKMPLVTDSAKKHFIGHLQQNKIKYVVGKAELIHSCDSVALASEVDRLARRLGVVQDVLIEVNVSGEADKHGFDFNVLWGAIDELNALENVRFRGLMTVLPHTNEREVAVCCEKMRELFDKLKEQCFGEQFEFLSMGMTEDYETAVSHGANMIRVGRGIFGERRINENGQN